MAIKPEMQLTRIGVQLVTKSRCMQPAATGNTAKNPNPRKTLWNRWVREGRAASIQNPRLDPNPMAVPQNTSGRAGPSGSTLATNDAVRNAKAVTPRPHATASNRARSGMSSLTSAFCRAVLSAERRGGGVG